MAALGFAFDIYELLMMPLIARPALAQLLGVPETDQAVRNWTGYIFWASAMSGGFFGLIGGYLTDRYGRRRVLVWSILLYAFSALAAGLFTTSAPMLLVLRCTTFIGVCVEFVAAVAWLAELFPNPRQRELVLGWTQAFSSGGGLLVTAAYYLSVQYRDYLPAVQGGHEPWRYTLISGVIPALPLIVIRPFLPESPAWREKAARGTLQRPSIWSLFEPQFLRTTLVTTILFACSYGAAFGAIQLTPQMVPGLPELAGLPRPEQQKVVSAVQMCQEIGGLLGRVALAFLTVYVVSRQKLLRLFQIPGLLLIPLVFLFPATGSLAQSNLLLLQMGIFVAGLLTVGQFSFWGNYLPRVYPTHLRGTGEGFAANVGGRMIGTSAALVTTQLAGRLPEGLGGHKLAYAAAAVVFAVYAVGLVFSFWLPEPKQEALPD
ncbi:MAG: MFS transporter [Gemmataceae bacterium]|nr:MFS transporter [Gemmataceae bacterium]